MISFLTSLSGVDWLDIIGTLMVLVGVTGGYILNRKKPLPEAKSDDLAPVKWKNELRTARRKRGHDIWEWLLIVGLALELSALPYHIKETAELRKENLKLEAKIQPRRIKPEQKKQITNALRNTAKGNVRITFTASDVECGIFALQIRDLLLELGFKVKFDHAVSPDWNFPVPKSVEFSLHERSEELPFAVQVFNAFLKAGLPVNATRSPEAEAGSLQISVWPKPIE